MEKPLIKKSGLNGFYQCEWDDGVIKGIGLTPKEAYDDWVSILGELHD